MKKRSAGITALGIVSLLIGGYCLLGLGVSLSASRPSDLTGDWLIAFMKMLMISILNFLAGAGLLMLKPWGRALVLLLASVAACSALINGVMSVKHFGTRFLFQPLVVAAWNGFVLWYILRPSVKAQFRKAG